MSNFFDRKIPDADNDFQSGEALEAFQVVDSDGGISHGLPKTSIEIKRVSQELLKYGFLEESHKPDLFQLAIRHEREIDAVLEPLDFELRLDTHRGIAFVKVAQTAYGGSEEDSAWLHPLVRRQRLTLEQSLMVAILRQAFIIHEQESGVGQGEARMVVDDLVPQFTAYFGDTGSDQKNETRLLNLLDQLKPHGIVSEVDKNHEVIIRPLITYLANPESLAALLDTLKSHGQAVEVVERDN